MKSPVPVTVYCLFCSNTGVPAGRVVGLYVLVEPSSNVIVVGSVTTVSLSIVLIALNFGFSLSFKITKSVVYLTSTILSPVTVSTVPYAGILGAPVCSLPCTSVVVKSSPTGRTSITVGMYVESIE